ncbi:nucleotidyltransferase family protein [Enterococcus rivorum]|uniref:Nucleotidyltransferase family protein n=1 Tax=Enterococcus rivorum TaxID=762845 RepID=A0A1E5KUZ8_9ENTE|nr:nucleotidyltransferase family protein [Enterococcus rivorum]MBP2100414.1 hypothetical protein [Enterococcus rivorum]OEH81716.1 hypothetical protein BCR26_15770 [Enterococcus rivorum]
MTIDEFKNYLVQDQEINDILEIIKKLQLPDCWLCAGTIRNYFWNLFSDVRSKTYISDVDVIFFDKTISYEETTRIEQKLKLNYPMYNWELKNEVYMHQHNQDISIAPYENSQDAISKFPEKCTAIAARKDSKNQLELFAPYGIEDIIQFRVSPTPFFLESELRLDIYKKRVLTKKWQEIWPCLTVDFINN